MLNYLNGYDTDLLCIFEAVMNEYPDLCTTVAHSGFPALQRDQRRTLTLDSSSARPICSAGSGEPIKPRQI